MTLRYQLLLYNHSVLLPSSLVLIIFQLDTDFCSAPTARDLIFNFLMLPTLGPYGALMFLNINKQPMGKASLINNSISHRSKNLQVYIQALQSPAPRLLSCSTRMWESRSRNGFATWRDHHCVTTCSSAIFLPIITRCC